MPPVFSNLHSLSSLSSSVVMLSLFSLSPPSLSSPLFQPPFHSTYLSISLHTQIHTPPPHLLLIFSFLSYSSSSPFHPHLPVILLLILFLLSSLTPCHLLLFFPSFHLPSGTDRSIVSDVAGTTRDTVDALVVRYTNTLSYT